MKEIDHLFKGRYSPVTHHISFFDLAIKEAIKTFCTTRNSGEKYKIKVRRVRGNFENCLDKLLPFGYPEKIIFLETTSRWTAAITNQQNGVLGLHNIGRLKMCDYIKVDCKFNNFQKRVNNWGGGSISVFRKGNSMFERHLWMHMGERKWEFIQSGDPYDFEDTEIFESRFDRDKFTMSQLNKICKAFNIDYFNEEFYKPKWKRAYLVEIHRDRYENEKSYNNWSDLKKKFGCNMYDEYGERTKFFYVPEINMLEYAVEFLEKNWNLTEQIRKLNFYKVGGWHLPNSDEILEIEQFINSINLTNDKAIAQLKLTKNALKIIQEK